MGGASARVYKVCGDYVVWLQLLLVGKTDAVHLGGETLSVN